MIFSVSLHQTYYESGCFNLSKVASNHLCQGPTKLNVYLGAEKKYLQAWMNRNSNRNGSCRIYGGVVLRDWFQKEFSLKENFFVKIETPYTLRLLKNNEIYV